MSKKISKDAARVKMKCGKSTHKSIRNTGQLLIKFDIDSETKIKVGTALLYMQISEKHFIVLTTASNFTT